MFRLKVPRIFWESLIPRFRWMTIDISNYLFELLRIHFSNCFQRLISHLKKNYSIDYLKVIWKIRSTFAEKLPRSSREVLICLLTVHRWRKISWNKVDHDPFIFSAWTISTKCHLNSFYLPLSCSIYVAVYFKCLSHERGDQRLSIFRLVESRDKKKQGPRTNGSWTLEMDFQCSWNTSPFHVSMIT